MTDQPFEGLLEVGFLSTDLGCRRTLYQANGHRIIQDLGMRIQDLMRGSYDGRGDCGFTGLSLCHRHTSSVFSSVPLMPNARLHLLPEAAAT